MTPMTQMTPLCINSLFTLAHAVIGTMRSLGSFEAGCAWFCFAVLVAGYFLLFRRAEDAAIRIRSDFRDLVLGLIGFAGKHR